MKTYALVLMGASLAIASCGQGHRMPPTASLELTGPADIHAREALGKTVIKDLNEPRLRALVRTRLPNADPASLGKLTLSLSTMTRHEGITQMWLECRVQGGTGTAEEHRLLDACMEETKVALKRAGGPS